MEPPILRASRALGTLAVAAVFATTAPAQMTFSIDYRGPSIGPVTEGDILTPALGFPAPGPVPPPVVFAAGGGGLGTLGLPAYGGCPGHAPGVPCGAEVDALSYGADGPACPGMLGGSWKFSVNRFDLSFPTPLPPNVFSETPIGEGAADVFVDIAPFPWPGGFVPPFVIPPGNVALSDGDGLPGPSPFAYPGIGLIEPHGAGCLPPDPGDDLDALDYDGPPGFPIYFSLDGAFGDVPCGLPLGASALANGFLPGDILVSGGAGPPAVWAPAAALGLGAADDLDALALFENGTGVFEPSPGPYVGWGGLTDMVVFSVRDGSPIIGVVDPVSLLPIAPGDLLIPPAAAGLPPQVLVAAENLGLATFRSIAMIPYQDELDALDVVLFPFTDCNGSGMEDLVDIATGLSADCNANFIPDECEVAGAYCTAGTSASGCTATISSTGSASASAASGFTVTASLVEGSKAGIFFFAQNGMQAAPWGSGTSYQCVVPPVMRGGLIFGGGTVGGCDGTFSQDLNARWCPACPKPLQAPTAGVPLQIQLWYRDPLNTSNQTTSLSDALEVLPCP